MYTGNKYEQVKNLDIKEIAKLVRQDLKKFKDCKFSVSIERFSMGRALNVTLICSSDLKKFTTFKSEYCDLRVVFEPSFKNELENIINQYNFDKSDSQTDYSHVNFYTSLEIDHNFKNKKLDQLQKFEKELVSRVSFFDKDDSKLKTNNFCQVRLPEELGVA